MMIRTFMLLYSGMGNIKKYTPAGLKRILRAIIPAPVKKKDRRTTVFITRPEGIVITKG